MSNRLIEPPFPEGRGVPQPIDPNGPRYVAYEPSESIRLAETATGPGELMAIFLKHKWTLAACMAAGVAAGIVIGILTPPSFRGRTSLQVDGFPEVALAADSTGFSPGSTTATSENYLQNQVKLLESESLARRVAEKLEFLPVESTNAWSRSLAMLRDKLGLYSRPETPEERHVRVVREALTVRTSLRSQVIELLYDARNPETAAAGANLAAAEFIAMNREARQELIGESTAWLNDQAAELKAKVESSNQRLQAFAKENGLIFAGTDDTLAQDRMRQIQDVLVRAEAERAAKQSRYEVMSKSGKLMSDAVGADLQKYQMDLQQMRRELSQLKTIYTSNHAKVTSLEAQIAETEKAIEQARNDVAGRIQSDYAAATGLERMLSDSQRSQMKTVEQQMAQQRQYEVMKSEANTLQRLYESVLQRLKEAGAASSLRSANVRIIDAAAVPRAPYSPNLPYNSAIGLAMGTLMAAGLVFMRGRVNKVKEPGDITVLNVPELGVIPSARHIPVTQNRPGLLSLWRDTDPGLVTWNHDSSPMSESFRATLSSILFGIDFGPKQRPHRAPARILTVSSIDPMAGKTTVLANLGVASAERKQRVLLIDCDLRRPRLHSLFHLPNDWGLSDILETNSLESLQTVPVEGLVRSTHIPNVSVMVSGPGHAAIPKLLYSAALNVLLQRLRREFDLVLIDTPPLMLYSDARYLGRLSDGLVMVVRANTVSREDLRAVYARLLQDGIRMAGTILNAWRMDSAQSRDYRAYYDRYERPAS